ncbi:helix-turn-helix transcriptional regulator [Flavobacterium lindanitolerans]|uniref:helix-turn-helix domain-containing protein n=1 Tax=Flavobacterium lindanitolerans TaxID=428988 RepID=UPI002808B834|nr:helix-turn-helix transcriptional regulator [Flavobacterium lindanitolerans]MDQ7960813.1 helix-turn-helix transcriptional regulator [Flavobacterium lindanitolerans]
MKIGEKLRLLRKLKGYTQETMAGKLHMERRSYANLENNVTKIDMERMAQIAEVYGIELEELLAFDENKIFEKCFNQNIESFYLVEEFKSTSIEEREFFIQQIQQLLETIDKERKVFIETIENLKAAIKKQNNTD